MKLLYNFGIRDAKWYGKNVYRKTLNVLSIKKWAAIGSAVVIAAGIITMAVQAGLGNRALNFSLEFVGGSTTTFTFDKEYTAEEIEDNIIPVTHGKFTRNCYYEKSVDVFDFGKKKFSAYNK